MKKDEVVSEERRRILVIKVNLLQKKNKVASFQNEGDIELVSKELNHLAAILHVYAGGLNFMK
jgi:hypothetical protein